jgi:Ca-activated chloride channel family protein
MYRFSLFIGLLLLAFVAQADDWRSLANAAGSGQLLIHAEDGWCPGLLLGTDVAVTVTGPVAEVRLTQRFRNPSRTFAEGVYVYPLPADAALHGMKMVMGERVIRGEIHEKQEARHLYRQASAQGKRAALVEQLDPGVFTTSVANIPPGQVIEVTLTYTQVLQRDASTFTLRLPLTITPRYAPAQSEPPSGLMPTSIQQAAQRTRQMPAVQLTAHVRVLLDPGLGITDLDSASHAIHVSQEGERYTIEPADGAFPMDRDFVLSWSLKPQAHTSASFLTQTRDGVHYGLLMMMPPQPRSGQQAVRKEQLLVIDHSGSMEGERIRQARKSLDYALHQLTPRDRFNVLAFNDATTRLFPQPVDATPENLQRALAFVDGIEAEGGTEILSALRTALEMERAPEYVHQVILATDAAVTNGQDILAMVHDKLGNARLFAVGIGDAPNAALLDGLARFGHGVAVMIADASQVNAAMQRLLQRISRPMLTNIQLHFPDGTSAQLAPGKIPDLYLGEPLMVAARLDRLPATVTITGNNPAPWQQVLRPDTDNHEGVARLWAERRIDELLDDLTRGGDEAGLRAQVVDIALRHQLVTRYTSFVAVDEKVLRKEGEPLDSDTIQPRLPQDMQTARRGFPDTALPTWHELGMAGIFALLACLLLLLAQWLKTGAQHECG